MSHKPTRPWRSKEGFGVVLGTVVVSLCSVTAASIAFWLGRTLARGWVEARVAASPKFRALDQAVAANGFKIVLARQLAAAGGQVGSVVVVDSGLHEDGYSGKWLVRDLLSMVRNFPRWVWMDVVQRPRQFLDHAQLKVRSHLTRLGRIFESKGEGATCGDPRLAGVFDVGPFDLA